jgi:hypothetical protein
MAASEDDDLRLMSLAGESANDRHQLIHGLPATPSAQIRGPCLLFHISEDPDIQAFAPRRSDYADEPVVWAIDDERLRNYLLPRDCPRVTCYAGPQTTDADRAQFLGTSKAVVAIESGWLERVQGCRLHCYHLPAQSFECIDQCAGYFVSRVAVLPERVEVVEDPLSELRRRGVQLRIGPNLWPLRDAVVTSSLLFSIIRMRNALPRERAARYRA